MRQIHLIRIEEYDGNNLKIYMTNQYFMYYFRD